MQLWALVVDSFRESMDRKIFWVLSAISVLIAAAMFCMSFEPDHVNFMFGAWKVETDLFDPTRALGRANIASVVVNCMDVIVGWVGLMLILVATAGFFPAFVERGAVDVLLSKPIGRGMLFFGKYVGSMVFVLFQASLFVVLTFLVVGIRWHVWLPGYLFSIPLVVIGFSYLYCISVWVGVATRSSVTAIFVCLGAWVLFTGIRGADDAFEMYPKWKEQQGVYYTIHALRWITPKMQDITYIAKRWSGGGPDVNLVPPTAKTDPASLAEARKMEEEAMKVNVVESIGTSLAFEALILALAIWRFHRRDF